MTNYSYGPPAGAPPAQGGGQAPERKGRFGGLGQIVSGRVFIDGIVMTVHRWRSLLLVELVLELVSCDTRYCMHS